MTLAAYPGKSDPIDSVSRALIVVDFEHHELHDGDHFFYTDKVTLGSAATQVYLITTPNNGKWCHLIFAATGSAITQVDLYEGADRTGTTGQTLFNSNRNSANAATMTVHKGISAGTTDGTLLWTMNSGSAQGSSRAGMASNRSNEIILKANTKYLLRITSGTADNLTNLQLEWYEHASG